MNQLALFAAVGACIPSEIDCLNRLTPEPSEKEVSVRIMIALAREWVVCPPLWLHVPM